MFDKNMFQIMCHIIGCNVSSGLEGKLENFWHKILYTLVFDGWKILEYQAWKILYMKI